MKITRWIALGLFMLASNLLHADLCVQSEIGLGGYWISWYDLSGIDYHTAAWASIETQDRIYNTSNDSSDLGCHAYVEIPDSYSYSYATAEDSLNTRINNSILLDLPESKGTAYSATIIKLLLLPDKNDTNTLIPLMLYFGFDVTSIFSSYRSNQGAYGQTSNFVSFEIQNEQGFYESTERSFFFDARESPDALNPSDPYNLLFNHQWVELYYDKLVPNAPIICTIKLETTAMITNPVPEPATLLLLALGGLVLRRNRN